jgi:RNA polymerase sigma factor (sigma-70 family)
MIERGRPEAGGASDEDEGSFERFLLEVERKLTVALVARYGGEVGREAAVEAFSWAWEHWDRLRVMGNPAGYLYRVGQTAARRRPAAARRLGGPSLADSPSLTASRSLAASPSPDHADAIGGDDRLPAALATLSLRQRQVAVLVHGYGFSHRETADLLGLSRSSVQNHAERGMTRLRRAMEVAP